MKASRERGWLGITLLALAAVGLAWLAVREVARGQNRRMEERGSVFHAGTEGARALMLLLKEEGLPVVTQVQPISSATPIGMLVVIDPGNALTSLQCEEIRDWVRRGGGLLVVSDQSCGLTDIFGVKYESKDRGLNLAWSAEDDPRAMMTRSGATLTGRGEPLLVNQAGIQAVEVEERQGTAVVLGDVWSTTNEGIDAADNATLILSWARWLSQGEEVRFLETVHGHLQEPSIPEWIMRAGFGPVVLQGFLVLAFAVWFWGARPAPVLAANSLIRRPAAEYAATMAHLYRRGKAARHAAQVITGEFELWLHRPAWTRGVARLDAAELNAAYAQAVLLGNEGQRLSNQSHPSIASVTYWSARVARFRGRFHAD